ncbi:hypothetical protein PsorP6_006203 [Peronosclerospora sorghi]|uniref:Uncharacterized protein n=1 Tax=Peronosclerospora sorghi TaxID=230839 RepID=A0ACC0W4H7_9STRA|nr:hypothetical protein PsorP6_006203 [Peronosclerospora sorghi]
MGDDVLRLRSHLQQMACDSLSDLEKKHVSNVMWLRNELTQISRTLDLKARFEFLESSTLASFPESQEDVYDVACPSLKKQKTEKEEEIASRAAVGQYEEEKPTRRSMRLRSSVSNIKRMPDPSVKRTRKRSCSSKWTKQDIVKMKVVDLRLELKKRGLSATGLKLSLLNRLLDAIDMEQKDDRTHLHQVDEILEEEPQVKKREVIVIDDTSEEDEVVQESAGYNNSRHSILPSQQSTSIKAVAKEETKATISAAVINDELDCPLQLEKERSEDVMKTASTEITGDTQSTLKLSPESNSEECFKQQEYSEPLKSSDSDNTLFDGTPWNKSVEIPESPKTARQSLQVVGRNSLTNQVGWKRKSILRKTSSLAHSTQRPVRNVSFARTDNLGMIVDSSQVDLNVISEKTTSYSKSSPENNSLDCVRSPVKASSECNLMKTYSDSKPCPAKAFSDSEPSPAKASLDFKPSPVKTFLGSKPIPAKKTLVSKPTPEKISLGPTPSPEVTSSNSRPSSEKTSLTSKPNPEKTSSTSKPNPEKTSSTSEPCPEKTSSTSEPCREKTSSTSKPHPEKTSSNFMSSREKTSFLDEPRTSPKERSDSISDVITKPKTVISIPLHYSPPPDSPEEHHCTEPDPEEETEEQRKKREFDETVEREAQKFRLAAKLSAKKRLEEAKATKALWAKGDELKARLRLSSFEKRQSARTPHSVIDKIPSHQVSPPVSASSTLPESTSLASDKGDQMAINSKVERQADRIRLHGESAKDGDCTQPMDRQFVVNSISDKPPSDKAVMCQSNAARATYSIVDDKHQVERSRAHRLVEKPAAKSMPATEIVPRPGKPKFPFRIDSLQSDRPIDVSSKTAAKNPEPLTLHATAPAADRDRLDSLSSTFSSIPEQSVVENTLKSEASKGARRPISNLVSGVHSFTTLLEKKSTQENSNGRSAPVVNALKLAEKSRLLEEKKRLEKERRKAILKKRMEDHKKLKEKNEKDAQVKREQERLHDIKKREAELARQRQQRLKEMRAGLEKRRAMLEAERKAAQTSNTASVLKPTASAPMTSHHKYGGLASASGTSQPPANLVSKVSQKTGSKLASVSKTHDASKPASNAVLSALTPRVPSKDARPSQSPVTYQLSDKAESSSDGENSDSDATRHGKKKVPRWAQKDHLNKILRVQFGKHAVDPSPSIFQDFVDTCNLEAIFETSDIQKKRKFARRTSSGNWLADCPTERDRALYRRDMGYER